MTTKFKLKKNNITVFQKPSLSLNLLSPTVRHHHQRSNSAPMCSGQVQVTDTNGDRNTRVNLEPQHAEEDHPQSVHMILCSARFLY